MTIASDILSILKPNDVTTLCEKVIIGSIFLMWSYVMYNLFFVQL